MLNSNELSVENEMEMYEINSSIEESDLFMSSEIAGQDIMYVNEELIETTESSILEENEEIPQQEAFKNEAKLKDGNVEWGGLRPARSVSDSRVISSPGAMTIVNSSKNGKRIEVSEWVMHGINNPSTINAAFEKNCVVIAGQLPSKGHDFHLKKNGKKSIVYSAELVAEIAEELGLDYSRGKTSITLTKVEYKEIEGFTAAVISL
jgi:hypothetical protein